MTAAAAPPPGTVAVWRVPLADGARPAERLAPVLSADEQERARRFRFDRDRDRYIVAHATLRKVLAHYLGVGATAVVFSYGQHGKPAVSGAGVSFNLAHGGDLALVAVAAAPSLVGVDVEEIRAGLDHERLAERFFSERERRDLRRVSQDQRLATFFSCWTRKEAFIKAVGDGLSYPLCDFDVSVGIGVPPRLLGCRPDPTAPARWSLADVAVPEGHVAAVAVDEPEIAVMARQWPAEDR